MTLALDAGALIGLLDPRDPHHRAVAAVFEGESRFLVHPINIAEALVNPDGEDRALDAYEDLVRLGVRPAVLGSNEALILAQVRRKHRLRMPDACALAVAIHEDIPLVTFDKRLAAAARRVGLFLHVDPDAYPADPSLD